jgi:hypothetical protein
LDHRPPVQPVDEAPGRPGSCIFPELPSPHSWVAPCLRCAAFPAAHLRVAPQCAPFSCAGDLIGELPRVSHPISAAAGEASGRPDSLLLLAAPAMSFRVAPSAASPAAPAVILRVAPRLRSSGGAVRQFSESPRLPHPSAVPTVNFRIAPNPLLRHCRLCVPGFPRVLHRRPGR